MKQLTPAEFDRLLAALPLQYAVVAILIRHGSLRLMQCLALAVGTVDRLTIGRGAATVRFYTNLRATAASGNRSALLFVARNGGPLHISTVQQALRVAGKRAGIRKPVNARALAAK